MTDYKALRALCEAATPGPWTVNTGPEMDDVIGGFTFIAHVPHPNAAFIAAARTALPELLDEVERLREHLTRVTNYLDSANVLLRESDEDGECDEAQDVINEARAALASRKDGGRDG